VSSEHAPLGQDYLIDMTYDYDVVNIGQKVVGIPSVKLTAYKPANATVPAGDGVESVLAWPNDGGDCPPDMLAGTIKLSMTQGMPLISEVTGGFDVHDLLNHLEEKYNAAVVR
jgi:hypothetical protein